MPLCFCVDILTEAQGGDVLDWQTHPVREQFKVGNQIGAGAFSTVYEATHRSQKGLHAALKVIFKRKPELDAKQQKLLLQEGHLLQRLKHEHLVTCYEVVDSHLQQVLVLELLKGGQLLTALSSVQGYGEATAARVFAQVASAIAYLHDNNVVHRDIKPENVVFCDSLQGSPRWESTQLKLVDLGMALKLAPGVAETGKMGSPGFVAPEVIDGMPHTPAMDCFALGVLLFIMLCGRYPMLNYQARNLAYSHIKAHDYPNMRTRRWRLLSEEARTLALGLLEQDPEKRMTARQAATDKWIRTARGGTGLDGVQRDVANVAKLRGTRDKTQDKSHSLARANTFDVKAQGRRAMSVFQGVPPQNHAASMRSVVEDMLRSFAHDLETLLPHRSKSDVGDKREPTVEVRTLRRHVTAQVVTRADLMSTMRSIAGAQVEEASNPAKLDSTLPGAFQQLKLAPGSSQSEGLIELFQPGAAVASVKGSTGSSYVLSGSRCLHASIPRFEKVDSEGPSELAATGSTDLCGYSPLGGHGDRERHPSAVPPTYAASGGDSVQMGLSNASFPVGSAKNVVAPLPRVTGGVWHPIAQSPASERHLPRDLSKLMQVMTLQKQDMATTEEDPGWAAQTLDRKLVGTVVATDSLYSRAEEPLVKGVGLPGEMRQSLGAGQSQGQH